MKPMTILGSLDPELSRRLATRRELLRAGGRRSAALAIASVPGVLAVLAKDAFAQGGLPQGIVDVLNFALTLEYLEDEFYRTGLDTPGLIPDQHRTVFQQISKHETAHVALLQGALGASAVEKPTFDFTAGGALDPFGDYATFQLLSQGFEDTGVRAYKGQAGNLIADDAILQTALRIHSVEARHASEVRRLRGQKGWITGNATDNGAIAAVYAGEEVTTQAGVDTAGFVSANAASEAFDEPLTREQVLEIASPFIVST